LQNTIKFRGRYRRSVHYIESLLVRFLRDKSLTSLAIDEVAGVAKFTLQKHLKRRVRDLAKIPENKAMLKDLFDMAFDADLFGRSRMLSLETGSALIEQALEYVETAESDGVRPSKVCLPE
jgi:hypothetical protein